MALEWKHDPTTGSTVSSIFFATVIELLRTFRNHINRKGRVTAVHRGSLASLDAKAEIQLTGHAIGQESVLDGGDGFDSNAAK